jgi:hypothetical protein
MNCLYMPMLREAWATGGELAEDGWCADATHYCALAEARYGARDDLLLLFIDVERLAAPPAHDVVAGVPALRITALPRDAVFEVDTLALGADGRYIEHHEVRALAVRSDHTPAMACERARQAMAGFDRPWWIAGGWAIDLFLGYRSRPHADLEIAICATDQRALYAHLRGWDLRRVAPGAGLEPWDGEPLTAPHHQIWARRGPYAALDTYAFCADATMLDFLIEDADAVTWRYRRNPAVARPLAEFGAVRDGTPYVRPEIALLYKAKARRHKDRRDHALVAPLLDDAARGWLERAIALCGYEW